MAITPGLTTEISSGRLHFFVNFCDPQYPQWHLLVSPVIIRWKVHSILTLHLPGKLFIVGRLPQTLVKEMLR